MSNSQIKRTRKRLSNKEKEELFKKAEELLERGFSFEAIVYELVISHETLFKILNDKGVVFNNDTWKNRKIYHVNEINKICSRLSKQLVVIEQVEQNAMIITSYNN